MGLLLGPGHQPSGIAAIGEDAGHEGIAPARCLEHLPGPVAVLDVGGMHLDGEQATIGVGQDMTLTTPNLLARVIAFGTPFCSAVLIDWLSRIAAVGLASRPTRSRSAMTRA